MRDALNSIFEEEGGAPLRDLLLGLVHDPVGTAGLGPELGDWNKEIYQNRIGLTKNELGILRKKGVI